jgi:feruloyl-CoA synthase
MDAAVTMTPTRPVRLGKLDAVFTERPDGSLVVRNPEPLAPHPARLTERLEHWARTAPDRIYIARRAPGGGDWIRVTYAQAHARMRAIGAALLARGLSPERPIAILSGNGIEHALLALAALHVGIPYSAISVPYSLVSTDFGKLKHIIGLLEPGLVFVDDGALFAKAIAAAVPESAELVVLANPTNDRPSTPFDDLLATEPDGVDAAAAHVGLDTIAKFLFTSGSTGVPKGVINTQLMLCSNQQMIAQSFPFLTDEPPVLLDWTPWNHTFGGNHDFGLIIYNGGTLYIDDGKPTPALIGESIRNLREISPTFYLNVPKGFEELVKYLKAEPALRKTFFARVRMLFYAGAALTQHVWDELDSLALETTGETIQKMAGFGSTETAPFALICRPDCAHAGVVGLPCPGIEIKLAPVGDKMEARIRGPNVTPGYWKMPAQTEAAFDDEGFYRFGDAFRFVDPARRELGFAFDGRITEDFKLATGTWVSVGPTRGRVLAVLAPYMHDAVIAGINRDYIAVLLVPDITACRALCGGVAEFHDHPALVGLVRDALAKLATTATGSASRVARALIMREPPNVDAGEITDKGSMNQRATLARRAALVEALYADPPPPDVITLGEFA